MKNNLDITPQLALSAARVIRDYCAQHNDNCTGCVLNPDDCTFTLPEDWNIPDRGDTNE